MIRASEIEININNAIYYLFSNSHVAKQYFVYDQRRVWFERSTSFAFIKYINNTLISKISFKGYRKTFKIMKNLRILGVINFYQRRNTMIKKKSYDEKTFQWIHISWEFWCITYIAAITFFFFYLLLKYQWTIFFFFFFFMKLYERIQRVIFFFYCRFKQVKSIFKVLMRFPFFKHNFITSWRKILNYSKYSKFKVLSFCCEKNFRAKIIIITLSNSKILKFP